MSWNRRQRHLRAALGLRRPRLTTRVRPGTPPGTLTAAETAEQPTFEVLTFGRGEMQAGRVDTLEGALAALTPGAVTWINIDGLGDASVFARLGERLGLHALALEDVLNVGQRPKVERFDKYLFVIMRTMRLERPPEAPQGMPIDPRSADVHSEQVSLFFGSDGRVREAGADYLAYLLIDAVVDAYFPVLDALAERMQALEEEALAPTVRAEETLLALARLRHDLIGVRRAVWPMREEAAALQREESTLVSAETRVFLRDVYDHAVQALEIVESLRETAVSVMEMFLSTQNQRLNEVMKVLTVISTLFIPLTFIASIYGMNFKHMPELNSPYGYPVVLGLMFLAAGGMIGYFKKRGWW